MASEVPLGKTPEADDHETGDSRIACRGCGSQPRIQEYARVRARESKVSPEMVSPPR
jgi:hypothetical protein